MDLTKIQYFLEAARLHNFTQAARNCHIAQTTMTKYISQLEKELGCRLFSREHRGVSLTAEGRRFYEGMEKICQEYQDLRSSLHLKQRKGLYLGIAMQEYIEALWLRRFEEAFPDCKMYFSFHDIEELEESLANGTLDGFLFSDAQSLRSRFTCQKLFAIRQSFICAKVLLERYGTVGNIIAHSPFVTKSNSPAYTAKIHQHCRHAFQQDFLSVRTCKTLSEQLLTVSLSQGFAILPMPESDAYPGLSVIPLGDEFTEHAVLAYRPDGMTEELKKFLSLFSGMP
ncbi:LysR family transcriptional regulator [Megasphaera sp. WILCCON 0056]|uniref:LysR family transcriptional regulator n=1 Tax=Megasphaera sp. WILCCON 0056 TaxID=3345340 RepID=UPI003A812AA5